MNCMVQPFYKSAAPRLSDLVCCSNIYKSVLIVHYLVLEPPCDQRIILLVFQSFMRPDCWIKKKVPVDISGIHLAVKLFYLGLHSCSASSIHLTEIILIYFFNQMNAAGAAR